MAAQRVLVWLLSLFGLAVLGADVSRAGAPVLPAAVYKGYAPIPPISGTPAQLTHAGTYSQTYNSPLGSYQVSITLAGAPAPYASAGVTSGDSASGQLFYYFEIVSNGGGATPAPVTLDVTASLLASSYGPGGASAAMQIEQVSGISFVYSSGGTNCSNELPCAVKGANWGACSLVEAPAYCGVEPTSVILSRAKESLDSNTIYLVELAAGAETPDPRVANRTSGGGKGVVDPYFAIDPSAPEGFSLAFSPDIKNSPTAGVPEPSSWILLSVGFAGAGFFRFSRKGLPQART
jgi:hypothetical protein